MSKLTDAIETANSVVDTIQALAENPIVNGLGLLSPYAGIVLNLLQRYRGVIDAAQPIIKSAVEAGEPVFDKVIEQLPQFGKVVAKITAVMPANQTPAVMVENITRSLGGVGHMTHEQEMRWMELATPPNNSQFGGA